MATYPTPRAFRRALNERAKAVAPDRISVAELMNQFYLQRLIARVFEHHPHGWLLKGGQALLARWPTARYSKDIDLLSTGHHADLSEAVGELRRAAALDLDDYLRFEFHSVSEGRAERVTRKVRFTVYCGQRLTEISVDVVTNLAPHGQPTEQTLIPAVVVRSTTSSRRCGYGRWKTTSRTRSPPCTRSIPAVSSRYKDLVDLIVIATSANLDGHTITAALHAEVMRRQAAGTDVTLPAVFTVPDRISWEPGYLAEAKRAHSLVPEYRVLGGAERLASRFVTPLLSGPTPQQWLFAESAWLNP